MGAGLSGSSCHKGQAWRLRVIGPSRGPRSWAELGVSGTRVSVGSWGRQTGWGSGAEDTVLTLWVFQCVGWTEARGTEQVGAPPGEGAQGLVGARRVAWSPVAGVTARRPRCPGLLLEKGGCCNGRVGPLDAARPRAAWGGPVGPPAFSKLCGPRGRSRGSMGTRLWVSVATAGRGQETRLRKEGHSWEEGAGRPG